MFEIARAKDSMPAAYLSNNIRGLSFPLLFPPMLADSSKGKYGIRLGLSAG